VADDAMGDGLVGLFGIAVVMTYPLRKQVYRRRAGALRYWMLMHVYIGALAGFGLNATRRQPYWWFANDIALHCF